MNPIKFKTLKNGDVFEYHFYPKDDELIIGRDEGFSANKQLWKDWCARDVVDSFEKFNIGGFATGENVLLYSLLIWNLTQTNDLLGVGTWETDYIQETLRQTPKLVNWEYKLEHEYETKDKSKRRNIGFEKAESPVITQYDKPINKTPTDKTGLFKLKTFSELMDFLKPGFSDVFNLSNFYITDNSELLINKLQSENKPNLKSLLNTQDIFIGLLIGEDMGYYDYLLISSKADLSEKLNSIAKKLNDFAREYISSIKSVETSDEMIELIENDLKKYALQQRI